MIAGNVNQAMQQAQTKSVDTWAFYQAKSTKQHVAEASLSVAIAVLGVTALTQKRWMLLVAAVFVLFGLVMGIAGFARASLHPDFIARLLS